ncbi:MAG: zinc-ribbon domain-containing protein [Candidatus Methanomethylicus sp.]|nr:zinc-ribbon domain-containing protein [Candidatus Methanomethylicus sp.]
MPEDGTAELKKSARILVPFVAVIALTAFPLGSMAWPIGFLLWIALVFGMLLLLVRWHAKNTLYHCPNCGNDFEISPVADLISPHGTANGGWTYLRCPRCQQMVRASEKTKAKT